MPHPDAAPPKGQRIFLALACTLAALAGTVACYGFGNRIGGPLVGVVLALNGAVFGSILAGALAERLCTWWRDARQRQRQRPWAV
jgi:hypothetical protein